MKAAVFNIQRFSIHDGPSIRTNIFFKGCPLRCAWCHNPEGLEQRPQISFIPAKCVGCGACAQVCPKQVHHLENGVHSLNRDACIGCGACAEACVFDALELFGKEYTVEELIPLALRDKAFYSNGGGVTLTGGEPMLQAEFVTEFARRIKELDTSVCIETSGYTDWEKLKAIAPYIDRFLFDIKETDDTRHIQFTGVSFQRIHENLSRLDGLGAKIILRCPLIPGVNDREEHILGIARIANSLHGCCEIDLEPYHPMGIEKAERIGRTLAYTQREFMDNTQAQSFKTILETKVSVPVIL